MTTQPQRFELARNIARAAGRITLPYFQTSRFTIEQKQDGSPVTDADRESEQFLRTEISKVFPDDGIIGEEFGEVRGSSGFCWVLDPIDGTKSFITGVPLYGTMVAVIDERDPSDKQAIIGAIHIPALDEGVFAAKGSGAWYHRGSEAPVRASVSRTKELAETIVLTSSVEGFAGRGDGSSLERLAQQARFTRTWGDVYGYLLVATGRADVMIDPQMSVWDAAAVQPIIEEAGGRFTDWKNKPTFEGGESVGSNGVVHEAILNALTR